MQGLLFFSVSYKTSQSMMVWYFLWSLIISLTGIHPAGHARNISGWPAMVAPCTICWNLNVWFHIMLRYYGGMRIEEQYNIDQISVIRNALGFQDLFLANLNSKGHILSSQEAHWPSFIRKAKQNLILEKWTASEIKYS